MARISSVFNCAFAIAVAAVPWFSSTEAHGILTSPKPEFVPGYMRTTYVDVIPALFEGKFNADPDTNCNNFNRAFLQQTTYRTLRDLVIDKGPQCGYTNPMAPPQQIPSDGHIVWQNPDTGEGFVPSHTGPCEVWLDDKLVFSDENCARRFPDHPAASIPIDFSSCQGRCLLQFYWLALHEPNWQVYKNCVPLAGYGKEAPPTDCPPSSPSMAPTPAPTEAPTYPPETPAPQPEDPRDEEPDDSECYW